MVLGCHTCLCKTVLKYIPYVFVFIKQFCMKAWPSLLNHCWHPSHRGWSTCAMCPCSFWSSSLCHQSNLWIRWSFPTTHPWAVFLLVSSILCAHSWTSATFLTQSWACSSICLCLQWCRRCMVCLQLWQFCSLHPGCLQLSGFWH